MNKKKVMIIDDDESILEVCKILLEKDYIVETSDKASSILNKAKDLPDLILLDILLGDEDGIEVAKKIKSKQKMKNIPIILFSAHSRGDSVAKTAGIKLFLQKPFDIDVLLKMVKNNIK